MAQHRYLKADWSNECLHCDERKSHKNHMSTQSPIIPQHFFEPTQYSNVHCLNCGMTQRWGNHFRVESVEHPKAPETIALKASGDCCGYPPKMTVSPWEGYTPPFTQEAIGHEESEAPGTLATDSAPMPNRSQLQKDITKAISMPTNPQDDSEDRESGTDSPSVNRLTLDTDFIAKIIAEEMAKLKAKTEVGSPEPLLANEQFEEGQEDFGDLLGELTSARDVIAEVSFPDEYEDVTMEEGIREHFPATIANLRKQQELGHTNTVIIPEGKMSETEFILNGRPFRVTNWGSQQGMHHPTKVTIELLAKEA